MSSELNRHGLSRDIGREIKHQVRKECGFGCVHCGFAICSYEHIDPEFKDARTHEPENIALLCEHCHSRVTRKFWSKEMIKQDRNNPWCIRNEKCHDAFDLSAQDLTVWLGPNKVVNVLEILKVNETTVLAIEPPEIVGGPYMLSGKFYDDNENLLFQLEKNEWIGSTNNWDIECTGGVITIRTAHRKIALKIRTNPPHGLIFEKVDMKYAGSVIKVDRNEVIVSNPNGATIRMSEKSVIGTGNGTLFSTSSERTSMGPGDFVVSSGVTLPPNFGG